MVLQPFLNTPKSSQASSFLCKKVPKGFLVPHLYLLFESYNFLPQRLIFASLSVYLKTLEVYVLYILTEIKTIEIYHSIWYSSDPKAGDNGLCVYGVGE